MSQQANQSKSRHSQEDPKEKIGPEIQAPPLTPPNPPKVEISEALKKKNPRLDHWSVLLAEADPHSPYDFAYRLRGEIHGHPNPRFTDGEIIPTSSLVSLDVGRRIAKTKNTTYDLGEPDPTFLDYIQNINKKLEDYNFSFEEDLRKVSRSL